ncbi:hypothetical protein ACFFX1_24240 [Dactylosporangium sucinum]|uniref:Uncharacterized protein n=1 Tax=Dactylosporangium sucinum TaxID=1424081 RepID=A0A917TYK3_9ACTN|nr:hypothetical protein [Dactylosporangium sucinum]GGM44048.1 hypothetical protein GCM10007977_052070 [Dactylosporangium sucinum]
MAGDARVPPAVRRGRPRRAPPGGRGGRRLHLGGHGQPATITDPTKQAAVVETAKKSFTTWAKAVRVLAPKANDPALRKAIDDQAAALDDTAATLTSLDQLTSSSGGMVSPPMQVAARETQAICG